MQTFVFHKIYQIVAARHKIMHFLLIFILLFFACKTVAQKNDYNYLSKVFHKSTNYGLIFKYNESLGILDTEHFLMDTSIRISAGITLNDSDGNLIGYFNGYNLHNKDNTIAINGSGFGKDYYFLSVFDDGNRPIFNYGAILPLPDDKRFVLFDTKIQNHGFDGFRLNTYVYQDEGYPIHVYASELNYTLIEIKDDGKLAVDNYIKEKTLIRGFFRPDINVCKHSNGREWWVMVNSIISDEMYSILLSEHGEILSIDTSRLSINNSRLANATTKTVFSSNGDRMARLIVRNFANTYLPIILEVFDFDRCSGRAGKEYYYTDTLESPEYIWVYNDMVFSPNDRFLYMAIGEYLLQYDYLETNPKYKIDTVAAFDNIFYLDYGNYPNMFYFLWKLPNGKIAVPWPRTSHLHMILEPDRKGKDCNFKHLFKPGIYDEPDSNHPLVFQPVHSFPYWPDFRMPPLNKNCDPDLKVDHCFRMTPNPFRDYLILDCINTSSGDQSYRVQVTNATGQLIYAQTLSDDFTSHHIQTAHWPPSMYFVTLSDQSGKSIHTYKMVKQ